jgi:hypothetical protein
MCFKGIELYSKDATAQNIERGRSQLRYGTPRLAIHLSETQMMLFNDKDLHVEFICPILVTTANLFVLNKGLNLKDFQNINQVIDIASEVPALILINPYSHLFTSYTETILADFHKKNPRAKERLEQLDLLIKQITHEEETKIKSLVSLFF